jgi:hypothetical protein
MFEIGTKKIPSTLAELVDPNRVALLVWDMEYAIAPHAFNYEHIAPKLKELSSSLVELFLELRLVRWN